MSVPTVLLVEDEASNRALLSRFLELVPGLNLVTASLGREGLRLAMRACPDLVLLDMRLPDMTGVEVLRQLRTHESTRDVHIVILTADVTPEGERDVEPFDVDAYLTKPVPLTTFLRIVRTALRAAA